MIDPGSLKWKKGSQWSLEILGLCPHSNLQIAWHKCHWGSSRTHNLYWQNLNFSFSDTIFQEDSKILENVTKSKEGKPIKEAKAAAKIRHRFSKFAQNSPQKWYWHFTGVKSTMFGECWRHKVVFVFGFKRPLLLFLHLKSPKVAVLGCKKTGHLIPYIQRWLYISRRLTKINFAFWGTSHLS